MNRRQWILGVALVTVIGVMGGLYLFNRPTPPPPATHAAEVIGADEPHSLGDPAAKVTLIEYAALTCPWCAAFNNNVVQSLKQNYVKSGKVRYVLRLIPIDVADAKAEALATCMGPAKFLDAVDLLYLHQDEWGPEQMGEHGLAPDAQPRTDAGLIKMAGLLGLDDARARVCLVGKDALERLRRTAERGVILYGISSTPTLIVNGQAVTTPRTPEELAQLLDPLLEAR